MDDLWDLLDDPVFIILAPVSLILIVLIVWLATGHHTGHHVTPKSTVTVTHTVSGVGHA